MWLDKLFGTKASSRSQKVDTNKSTLTAHEQSTQTKEMLEKKIAVIERKIKDEVKRALDYKKNKNDKAAVQCLRRKKLYEKQIEQHNNQLLRIEEQLMQLESSTATAEVFAAMKGANEATQANLRSANLDRFDKVIDDIQETQDELAGISMALERPIGNTIADDDELLAEIEEMESTELDKELMEASTSAIESRNHIDMEEKDANPRPAAVEPQDDVSAELEALSAELAI